MGLFSRKPDLRVVYLQSRLLLKIIVFAIPHSSVFGQRIDVGNLCHKSAICGYLCSHPSGKSGEWVWIWNHQGQHLYGELRTTKMLLDVRIDVAIVSKATIIPRPERRR